MENRAVLMPTPGDPFMLRYWIDNFKTYKHLVGKLYVCMNSPIEKEAVDYMREIVESVGGEFIYIDHQVQHGDGILACLEACKEKYVMLIEDDCYVIKPDFVNRCFEKIESGEADLIGSKRGSCAFEILDEASKKWGIPYEGTGDQGCNFWPSFVFTKRKTLMDTDKDFNAKAWNEGDELAGLGMIADKTIYGDTFVNTSLQLRGKIAGDKILTVPQYHAGSVDLGEYNDNKGLFDGKCPWVHIGSLSSGICGVIADEQNRALAYRSGEPKSEPPYKPEWCNSDMERLEWTRRICFWLRYYETRQLGVLDELAEDYHNGLLRIMSFYRINMKKVKQLQFIYSTLGL